MADSNVNLIVKNNLIKSAHEDSKQASPNYVIYFLPFTSRHQNIEKPSNDSFVNQAMSVGNPYIVVNDAVKITVTSSKGSPLSTAEIILTPGDINYSAAIIPGDHAMIWMHDNVTSWDIISKQVQSGFGCNSYASGLKFVGKVNSVRQVLNSNPANGAVSHRFLITLTAFSEMETHIYFNPYLDPTDVNQNNQASRTVDFFSRISDQYNDLINEIKQNGRLPSDRAISFFLNVFVGAGPKESNSTGNPKLDVSPNSSFLVPTRLAKMLGIEIKDKNAVGFQYSDLLMRILGLQKFDNRYTPIHKLNGKSIHLNCKSLKGAILVKVGNFNNVSLWSLLQEYANLSLNELYVSLRYVKTGSREGIFPTVTLRQIPFSTPKYKKEHPGVEITEFSDIPRWILSETYPIFNYNIGTSNAEKFNFFQVFTNSISSSEKPEDIQRQQIALGNTRIDELDIVRSGPRIFSTMSETDSSVKDDTQDPIYINEWADLIADFHANGHLRMNGTITVAGIQHPIAVGDNLQFDNKIFHIEGITHDFETQGSSGKKSFTTTLMLSRGHYLGADGKLYFMCDMAQVREAMNDKLLPGYSDEERYINDLPIVSGTTTEEVKKSLPQQNFKDVFKSQAEAAKQKLKNKISGKK